MQELGFTDCADKNYVFEFESLTFITPSKREIVMTEGPHWENYIIRLVSFEKTFTQFLFTELMKLENQLPDFIQQGIDSLKLSGLISQDNIINFDFLNNIKNLNINYEYCIKYHEYF